MAPVNTSDLSSAIVQGLCFFGTVIEFTLPTMRHLRGACKFRQEEIKRKVAMFTLQRETLGMLRLTALSAKANRAGLIGAECTCIHNSLERCQVEETLESTCFQRRSQRQVESSEERDGSLENVKSAFMIYWLPLYLLKFPVYNLPLAQVVIEAVIRRW
ncbi:hypothetical protein FQA39_LY00744 [Lamprigera yunnana]|nr:hypothetical protein FQA39_LY00744 [Lamprigera yunnana]